MLERREIQVTRGFDRIEMRETDSGYRDRFSKTAFRVGPIDFNLRSGELVFITGGNGSGKSTFMRVLNKAIQKAS
jgi:ABC-type siderophore export system fused ATPase/permease subunit